MTLHLELDLDPTVNFAMQQNDVPVVKAIRLSNAGEEELRELVVRVWGEPEFMVPWSGRVAAIAPGGTYNLELPEIELSASFLLELTERLVGAVHIAVVRDDQPVAQLRQRIEVLARDQWSGMRSLPENPDRVRPAQPSGHRTTPRRSSAYPGAMDWRCVALKLPDAQP